MTDAFPSPPPDADDSALAAALELGRAQALYINFCRVTSTPEELILDFALQSEHAPGDQTLVAPQRITLGLYTAKRLLEALQTALARYEEAFGQVDPTIAHRRVDRPGGA